MDILLYEQVPGDSEVPVKTLIVAGSAAAIALHPEAHSFVMDEMTAAHSLRYKPPMSWSPRS